MSEDYSFDLSKYQLLNEVGSGSFGSVYKVKDKETGKIYAAKISKLKLQDTDSQSQILNIVREVNINAKIDHPSVSKFIGFSPNDFNGEPKPVIITEYIPNGALSKHIELERQSCADHRWNDTRKLITIYGIASAMAFLHSNEIIHRDLKPDNILMDEDFHPKIVDFGLSKAENSKSMVISLNGFKGTVLYAAPEAFLEEQYLPAGDVYAFSMITYEIYTNERPFNNYNFEKILKCLHEGQRPKFNTQIPECIKELIEKCWANNPNDRPTFDEIVEELTTNREFITETVDETEYLNYIDYLNESKKTFNSIRRILTYKDFLMKMKGTDDNSEERTKVEEQEKIIENSEDDEKIEEKDKKVDNDDDAPIDKTDEKKKDHLRDAKKLYSKWKKYYNGKDVRVNKKKAAKALKKSADKGYVKAMKKYAMMLKEGDGIEINNEESLKYFKMAADNKDYDSLAKYGDLLLITKPKDEAALKESLQCFKTAIENGNIDAIVYLGYTYANPENKLDQNVGISYLKEAIEKDCDLAYLYYGLIYIGGYGVKKDLKEAKKYLKISIDRGNKAAFLYYGLSFLLPENEPINKIEAMKYIKLSADKGLVEGMYYYGFIALSNPDLKIDNKEIFKYLKKAVDLGNIDAMSVYGNQLTTGENIKLDVEEGVKYLRKAVDKGHDEATVFLAELMVEGEKVKKDTVEAFRLLKINADKGGPSCMLCCSVYLENGTGTPVDKEESIRYLKKSADAGFATAQTVYGSKLQLGNGVPKDEKEAFRYYQLAADQNDKDGIFALGYCYISGFGVPIDTQKAVQLVKKAADISQVNAMTFYGIFAQQGNGVQQNDIEAAKYFKLAADNGDAEGLNHYGLCCLDGKGIPVNKNEAFRCFKLAAEQDLTIGYYNYAYMLENGFGCKKNLQEAARYYKMAADKGNYDAMKKVEKLKDDEDDEDCLIA